jgi:hypothetical protein
MHFIYDPRGRLEAGTDGIIELRDPKSGAPLGNLLGVQVKSTESGAYIRENDRSFEYLLKPDDLKYWRTSNIPVIVVLWRKSDETAYWKDVTDCVKGEERRLKFDKDADVFDPRSADRIGSLTIDLRTAGVFLPPLNTGEELIINLLRIKLPDEIFLATSPFGGGRDAIPELVKHENPRFDWVIRKRRFVSFFDPREYSTRAIVDPDQVEAVDTALFAFNDDLDDTNDMIDLLRRTVERQTSSQLSYLRKERLFHFRASAMNKSRSYRYFASVNETSARVVSAYANKKNPNGQGYVRHHAARLRFDRLADEWFAVMDPDFYFTRDGFQPHRFPGACLGLVRPGGKPLLGGCELSVGAGVKLFQLAQRRRRQAVYLRRVAVLGSEHVDRREARLPSDAIPKVNCKTDIAGPKGIPSAANDDLRSAILDDGRHSELACAVEPNRVVRAAVELEECVAIPTRAVAKVRALGKWSGSPGEATGIQKKCVKFRRSEGRIRKCRHHARRTVTVLTHRRRLLALASRPPRCPNFRPPRIRGKRLRHKLSHLRLLRRRQPIPPVQQRDGVAGETVNGPEPTVVLTIKILCPKWTLRRVLQSG